MQLLWAVRGPVLAFLGPSRACLVIIVSPLLGGSDTAENHFHTFSSSYQVIHIPTSSSRSLPDGKHCSKTSATFFHAILQRLSPGPTASQNSEPEGSPAKPSLPHSRGRSHNWQKEALLQSAPSGSRLRASEVPKTLLLNCLIIPISMIAAQWKTY